MSVQQQGFLNDFEQKMSKLTEVRRNVQQSIQFKQQFTNELKTKLGEINNRLQTLADLISQLKTRATNLETQITTNSSDILGKQKQIEDLQRQMNSDSQLKGDTQQKIAALENQVKTYQEQIKTLTDKSTALEKDLLSRGDPASHARTIQELTQKCELEKSQLVLQVNAANSKIAQLEQQKQQIEQNQNQNQGQVQTLQTQIKNLEQDNKQLIDKLMAAIQAIDGATNDLRSLIDTVPNAQTKQEVDKLLSQISLQIEGSISSLQNTSRSSVPPTTTSSSGFLGMFGSRSNPLSPGRGTGAPPGSRLAAANPVNNSPGFGQAFTQSRDSFAMNSPMGSPPQLPPKPKPTNSDLIPIPGRPTPTSLGDLKTMLRLKARQSGKNVFGVNKYQNVLNDIDKQNSIDEILTLLSKNGITFINNILKGGKTRNPKKTKRNKKQKGGFTYKKKFRRSSITSHSRYNRSSKSKRSSR